MSNITLSIGGRAYTVACADGEESHVAGLGRMIDAKVGAMDGVASQNESRALLFAALLLALIAAEILLSRRLRQWHSALQPTLAQPQMQQGEGPVGPIQR